MWFMHQKFSTVHMVSSLTSKSPANVHNMKVVHDSYLFHIHMVPSSISVISDCKSEQSLQRRLLLLNNSNILVHLLPQQYMAVVSSRWSTAWSFVDSISHWSILKQQCVSTIMAKCILKGFTLVLVLWHHFYKLRPSNVPHCSYVSLYTTLWNVAFFYCVACQQSIIKLIVSDPHCISYFGYHNNTMLFLVWFWFIKENNLSCGYWRI